MQIFKFGGVLVLAVQLFKKIKKKNLKKKIAVFPTNYVKIYIFLVFFLFLYVLNIDVTRNGNNLKLRVKSTLLSVRWT